MVILRTLRLQLESLKMKELETVDQFMIGVSGIVTQFQNILRCLTKKFSMLVTAIEEAKDMSHHPRRVD